MNTNLTKQGTVPQKGIDRLKYIKSLTELVIDNPSHLIAVALRDGAYLYHRIAIECDWDWLNFDYVLYPEPPKIQLRLPMYIKHADIYTKTVVALYKDLQRFVFIDQRTNIDFIDLSKTNKYPDIQYSHDGINWQPFTGNEVI